MHQFILLIEQLVESVRVFAYALVFLAAFFETLPLIGLIVPGALVTIFGGFLVFRGSADLGDMIFFATAGAVLGDWLGYALGRLIRLLNMFLPLEKFGPLKKAERYFVAKGGWSIVYGRFLTPLRGLVPLAAGVGNMSQGRFLLYNLGGGLAWVIVHVLVGYFAGTSWSAAGKYLGEYGLLVFLAVPVLYYFLQRRFKRFSSESLSDTPPAV